MFRDYYLIYSEFSEINPELFLNSYSGQIGLRAGDNIISLAVLFGYKREKITLSGISRKVGDSYQYTTVERRNDGFITTFRAVVNPKNTAVFRPTLFAEISLTPVRTYELTNWVSMRSGVLIPWWYVK